MSRPELPQIAHWIDTTLVALLEQRRREKKQWHRHRKLGTLQTLWLMLAVSMDTQRSSLHEILSLAMYVLSIALVDVLELSHVASTSNRCEGAPPNIAQEPIPYPASIADRNTT